MDGDIQLFGEAHVVREKAVTNHMVWNTSIDVKLVVRCGLDFAMVRRFGV